MTHDDVIKLAIANQTALDAFARAASAQQGRGVVLAHVETLQQNIASDETLRFVPLDYIPKADDFRPVIEAYDPEREIVLLVGGLPDDNEMLLKIAADDTPAN